jgi:hypothetical protein
LPWLDHYEKFTDKLKHLGHPSGDLSMITKSKSISSLVAFLLFAMPLAVVAQKKKGPPHYAVPANTVMRLRLNTELNSKRAHVGDRFQSTVVDPVYARGLQVIPAGSIVNGTVTHVERASRKSNAGSINVTFNSVQVPNGKTYALNGSLATSDADNEGEVKGKSSKKRNVAFIGGGAVVGGLINGAAGAGIGAGLGVAGALLSKGKEAEVKAGTEFNMILNSRLLMPEYRGGV